jgi:hypothetical protein
MMNMMKALLFLVVCYLCTTLHAQNVGINTPTPTSSLDINGGQRLRSATTTVSGASVMIASNRAHHVLIGGSVDFTISFIDATLEGQHVIITNNTSYKGFLVPINIQPGTTVELIYSISAWKLIGTNEAISTTAWSRSGNGGTIDGLNNLFGTTDFKPIRFIENGHPAGYMDARSGNYFFGNAAGGSMQAIGNTTGGDNTAVGSYALVSDTAANGTVAIGAGALFYNQARLGNTAVGSYALFNNTFTNSTPILATQGLHNTALGNSALTSNRRGSGGVAIGFQAAYSDTAANGIVAIGRNALYTNNGRAGNVAIGDEALFSNGLSASTSFHATWNTAIGNKALFSNTIGYANTAVGFNAMYGNLTGTDNTAIGTNALSANAGSANTSIGGFSLAQNQGFRNTAIGIDALRGNINGSGNIAIGSSAGRNETTSNKLYIENSIGDKDNSLIYGDFAADSLNLNARVTIRDFTRLGRVSEAAPLIKMKKFTGTSSPSQNGFTDITHGLSRAKIIGVQVIMKLPGFVDLGPGSRVNSGYEYEFQILDSIIRIANFNGNSANILSKNFVVLVTYEE